MMADLMARRIVSDRTAATREHDLTFADAEALEARLVDEAAMVDPDGAWLIVWLDYAVGAGYVRAGRLRTKELVEPQYLQELRLFGARGEWRLWRTGSTFAARRRLDGAGTPVEILEDDQSLWGTVAQPGPDGWTQVSEARGIRFDLPVTVTAADLPLRLGMRHYLGFDDAGMVGVTDSRLVGLYRMQGTPLPKEGEEHA